MSDYRNYAEQILLGENLQDKLLEIPFQWSEWQEYELPKNPGRSKRLAFSEDKLKFPKVTRLNEADKKAMALHSFANHELLAIEMMASALLIYPHKSEADLRFKKGIYSALKDEQKHLSLYISRMNELGFDFGDFPLNNYFWRQMEKLKTPAQYTSVMALTFEAANLDFANYYAGIFRDMGDEKTAGILEEVLEDEISHVAFGAYWMKKWRTDKDLWEYYRSSLPFPMTPARSKGLYFKPELHAKAMGDDDFLKSLIAYEDDFDPTRRKHD